MSDIRKEKTLVSQLDIGMFVSELDRPWLGTPFLLEGLLIEDKEQIATVAQLCQFVYVDRTFSVGNYYLPPPKQAVAGNHKNSSQTDNVNSKQAVVTHLKQNPTSDKFLFFEVLKEIKANNKNSASNKPALNRESDAVMLNMTSIDHHTSQPADNASTNDTKSSFSSQIKKDFSNFIAELKHWGLRKRQSHTKTPMTTHGAGLGDMLNGATIEQRVPVEEEIVKIYPVYEETQIATREFFEALAADQQIDLTKVDNALTGMVESIERNPDALMWLTKLKQTDNYAYNHALNVSITLMALASFMSLPKKQIKDLGLAGLLQDVGKVKIPAELLHKEGKISEAEFETLKKHVDYALELLEVTESTSDTVILTISQHHERIDGSGYPHQLSGKEISLSGQMSGLIDTYCAITSSKAYAKGVYNQAALEKIQALRETKFNGLLVDQLVQFMGMYPVSSLVELNSGEIGVVVQQNSVRRLLPRIMILLNPDKSKNEYPATINLINSPLTPSGDPYKIVKGLPADSYGLNISNYFV